MSYPPPFAAEAVQPFFWTTIAVIGLCVGVVYVAMLAFVMKTYKRCPSNRVLVIFGRNGRGGASRCIHGGAAFVIPLIQDYAYLSLEPIQIEIPLRDAPSRENIPVNVTAVFTVAIGTEPSVLQQASIRLLGLSVGEIRKQSAELISDQLRHVIASMGIEDIHRDRDAFLQQTQRSLEPKLMKIGLVLINASITNITDKSGYIDTMGEKVGKAALVHKVLAAFDGSAQRLVAHLLEEGKLSEEDRNEIRRLLDATSSSP
jgi:flotillin